MPMSSVSSVTPSSGLGRLRQPLMLIVPPQNLMGTACLNPMMSGGGAPFTVGLTANRPEEDEYLITAKAQHSPSYPIMEDCLQHVKTQPPAKPLHLTQIFVLL